MIEQAPLTQVESLSTETIIIADIIGEVTLTDVSTAPARPNAISRLGYQTVVMFVGTMMPWWKPDPKFLS